ncbi:MAG: ethanolamine utilization protein EutJ [Desulfosarcina sp.]|nr:ethanolamine utilization protein EutJ [Desulfosarcina sp.]MBC2743607.1 ethanolamine utilization protein EutJ [Desulfosarcina sp.]MBC2766516.1 ethanolamine utilization protein EutJ [Desulfosarcina sp.]
MTISESSNQLIKDFEAALNLDGHPHSGQPLFAGVDLGTAYIVTAVVDSRGTPLAGALTRSRASIRDGLVLDYVGSITILRQQVEMLRRSGFPLQLASAAFPPGTTGKNAQAFGNVLQAVGLDVAGLTDEPTAASLVLDIDEGAVVDIGGGTTGISVIQNGEVVYTADEPTGGIHVDLVLAGHYRIDEHEAESIKTDSVRQAEIFPLIQPVFQKMASIVKQHLQGYPVKTLYLVGGTSCFPGIERVMEAETGLTVARPHNPLLVTPLGIALSCLKENAVELRAETEGK